MNFTIEIYTLVIGLIIYFGRKDIDRFILMNILGIGGIVLSLLLPITLVMGLAGLGLLIFDIFNAEEGKRFSLIFLFSICFIFLFTSEKASRLMMIGTIAITILYSYFIVSWIHQLFNREKRTK